MQKFTIKAVKVGIDTTATALTAAREEVAGGTFTVRAFRRFAAEAGAGLRALRHQAAEIWHDERCRGQDPSSARAKNEAEVGRRGGDGQLRLALAGATSSRR